jgi:hypothetical protein
MLRVYHRIGRGGEFEMYIPEIVVGIILGAVGATVAITVVSVEYNKHKKKGE